MILYFLFGCLFFQAANAQLILSAEEVALSDSLRLEVVVTGAPPLRVETPEVWLVPPSSSAWKITALGNPTVEAATTGEQVWKQVFRLDPYLPGESVPLQLAPCRVFTGNNATPQDITFPLQKVRVITSFMNVAISEARPATGYENPPSSVPPANSNSLWFALAGAIVALIGMGIILKIQNRSNHTRTLGNVQDRIQQLEPAYVSAEVINQAVRDYVSVKFGLAATTMTTAEFISHMKGNQASDSWATVLTICDRARFMGRELELQERQELSVLLPKLWAEESIPSR